MAFKLIVQNSKIILKSVANYIINATGIKDLFTGDSSIDANGKINWTLQHYADTAANFTSNNPTLLVGQIGIETDDLLTTPKFKIGDGANDWNTLPYFSSGGGSQTLQNVVDLDSHLSGTIYSPDNNTTISIGNNNLGLSTDGFLNLDGNIVNINGVQAATINDILNLVPYTGATNDVDLGNNGLNAKNIKIKGTAGNGHLALKHQSSNITASASESSLGADSSGNPVWKNDGNALDSLELQSNKTSTVTGNESSISKYLTVKGVYDWVIGLGYLTSSSITGKEDTSNKSSSYTASSTTTYANTKALVDGLSTKPDKAASNIFMYRNFK